VNGMPTPNLDKPHAGDRLRDGRAGRPLNVARGRVTPNWGLEGTRGSLTFWSACWSGPC